MAQFGKVHSDLQPVAVFDAGSYTSDSVTFTGVVASGTTITVSSLSGTFAAGQVLRGPAVPAGTKVVSYAAPTLTVTGPAALTVSATPVSMAALTMGTVAATVQPQGPKLEFFTLTITDSAYEQAIQEIQQLATVYIYEIVSTTSMAVAVYPVSAWKVGDTTTNISAIANGATFTN